ncbi:MAG: hypothetical protein NT027_11765 [Proteobacteria bacterium]|nr:hypothetical protein [Pseudomonadota bacterium]
MRNFKVTGLGFVLAILFGAHNLFAQGLQESTGSRILDEIVASDHGTTGLEEGGRLDVRPLPVLPLPTHRVDCRRFNQDPRRCEAHPACQYSRIYSACLPSNGGGDPGPGDQCSYYNFDYYNCINAGCLFDQGSSVCHSGYNPEPTLPLYCSDFNRRPAVCRSNGCTYDRRSGSCY